MAIFLKSAAELLRLYKYVKTNSLFRRNIWFIDGNAKCHQLEKLTCKVTLRQVFICLRPRISYPTPLYTLHTCIQSTCSHREGGGESWSSEKVRGATVHKAGSKILTCLTGSPLLQSMNSEKLLPQSPFTGQFFRWWHFALVTVWYEKLFIAYWNQTCLAYSSFISCVTREGSISNEWINMH